MKNFCVINGTVLCVAKATIYRRGMTRRQLRDGRRVSGMSKPGKVRERLEAMAKMKNYPVWGF